MQSATRVKETKTAARHWVARVIGTLVAVAGIVPFAAGQGLAATSTLTVASVYFDNTASDHAEGVMYGPMWGSTPGPIATFTDSDACPTPTTCQVAAEYRGHVLWSDGTGRTTCPAVDCTIAFSSQSGTTGTYTIAATHAFVDEKNCPTPPACGFTTKVTVDDNADVANSGAAGDNTANLGLSVADQASGPSGSLFSFSATTGTPFSGQIGSFHDGNQLSVATDGNGTKPEYTFNTKWGDGSATDATGTFQIDTANCGTAPGLGTGQGCPVKLFGGPHTYATSGTYTVIMVVGDGRDKKAVTVTSTANVTTAGGSNCSTATLSPTNPTVPTGTQQQFTATSTVCSAPLYQFWLQYPAGTGPWVIKQAFSSSATWTWNTTGSYPGAYNVVVWANQSGHSTAKYEAFAETSATLTGCGSVSVSASPGSPQRRGTKITVTGTTSGCANPQFEFWMLAPGSSTWQDVQPYSASAAFTWNTTAGMAAGTYNFSVWAKDVSSGGAAGNSLGRWDNYSPFTYKLT